MTPGVVRGGACAIREARWPQDREVVEDLFREYVAGLGVDVSFQNIEDEFATLPGKYARPSGCVLLAWGDDGPAGVAAWRTIGPGVAEMKRLYVRREWRGLSVGRVLASAIVKDAREAGFRSIVLDTLGSMQAARRLYAGLGFQPIPPYYANISGSISPNRAFSGNARPRTRSGGSRFAAKNATKSAGAGNRRSG